MHTSPELEKEPALQQLDFRQLKTDNTLSFQDCKRVKAAVFCHPVCEICYSNNGKLVQCIRLDAPDE